MTWRRRWTSGRSDRGVAARQRFIWPTIWEDPAFGRMSHGARLLYIACFSNADDEGRLIGDPAHLRSIAFAYDDLELDDVRALRDEVAATMGCFCTYDFHRVEYVAFLNWGDFQRPKYPKVSKHPKPPKGRKASSDAGLNSPKLGGSFPQASPIGLGWVGKGSNPLPPSEKGELSLRDKGENPRALGTNPRAATKTAKHRAGLEQFVRLHWDEYPDKSVLFDELCDRGASPGEADELLSEEKRRRGTEAA